MAVPLAGSHTTRKAESLCVQWLALYGGLASYLYMYYVDVEGSGLPVLQAYRAVSSEFDHTGPPRTTVSI